MAIFVCSIIGFIFSIGIYLLLSRNLLRWILGIAILTSSVNLLILIAGRLTPAIPPFIPIDYLKSITAIANPLPQALILTAIVIGFGLLVFALVLVRVIWRRIGYVDSDEVHLAETVHHKIRPANE